LHLGLSLALKKLLEDGFLPSQFCDQVLSLVQKLLLADEFLVETVDKAQYLLHSQGEMLLLEDTHIQMGETSSSVSLPILRQQELHGRFILVLLYIVLSLAAVRICHQGDEVLELVIDGLDSLPAQVEFAGLFLPMVIRVEVIVLAFRASKVHLLLIIIVIIIIVCQLIEH